MFFLVFLLNFIRKWSLVDRHVEDGDSVRHAVFCHTICSWSCRGSGLFPFLSRAGQRLIDDLKVLIVILNEETPSLTHTRLPFTFFLPRKIVHSHSLPPPCYFLSRNGDVPKSIYGLGLFSSFYHNSIIPISERSTYLNADWNFGIVVGMDGAHLHVVARVDGWM